MGTPLLPMQDKLTPSGAEHVPASQDELRMPVKHGAQKRRLKNG